MKSGGMRWTGGGMRWTEDQLDGYRKGENAEPASPLESQVLADCLSFCALHPKVAWAFRQNVGAFTDERGNFIKFAWKGAADITGQLKDGRRFEFECKRMHARPSDNQAAFLAIVNSNGGVAGWGGLPELDRLLREA